MWYVIRIYTLVVTLQKIYASRKSTKHTAPYLASEAAQNVGPPWPARITLSGGLEVEYIPSLLAESIPVTEEKKEGKPSRRWQDKQVGPQPLTACDSEDEEIDNIVFFVLFRQHLLCASLLHTVQNNPKHTFHLAESASKQHQLTKSAKLLILMNAERVIPTTL